MSHNSKIEFIARLLPDIFNESIASINIKIETKIEKYLPKLIIFDNN